jgi:cell wall-associated NlpC family hydrolase
VVTAPDASAATIGQQAVSEASRHSGQPVVDGVRHVSSASNSSGDLIMMRNSSGRISHAGIAGSNRWWVSANNSDHVKLQSLNSSKFAVGRVT